MRGRVSGRPTKWLRATINQRPLSNVLLAPRVEDTSIVSVAVMPLTDSIITQESTWSVFDMIHARRDESVTEKAERVRLLGVTNAWEP